MRATVTVCPRPGVLDIQPHMLGVETASDRGRVIKLASNESALGPSPDAIAAAREAMARIQWYPEQGMGELREAIARYFGLEPARIACGFGSDDLLSRLARAYLGPGDELLRSAHGYAKFANYAHMAGARVVSAPDEGLRVDVASMLDCVTERTRMVAIANPDNPTASLLLGEEIRRLHAGLPDNVLLVLDSAYAEYVRAPGYELPSALVEEAHNVVMTRTFSKIFGLAGLRLGWLYAPLPIVDVVNRVGSTFAVSGPAMAAGVAALADTAYTAKVRAHNDRWLDALPRRLDSLGLHVYPSETNFVLVRFDDPLRPAAVAARFLGERGILVRRFPQPGLADHVRITLGLDHELEAAVSALREFMDARR